MSAFTQLLTEIAGTHSTMLAHNAESAAASLSHRLPCGDQVRHPPSESSQVQTGQDHRAKEYGHLTEGLKRCNRFRDAG